MGVEPADHDENGRIEKIAHGMQCELVRLGRAPCQALRQFVVIDRVECAHRDLDEEQNPEQLRCHSAASRNAAVWRISVPKRGWLTSKTNSKRPSPPSARAPVTAPGDSPLGSVKRRPKISRK